MLPSCTDVQKLKWGDIESVVEVHSISVLQRGRVEGKAGPNVTKQAQGSIERTRAWSTARPSRRIFSPKLGVDCLRWVGAGFSYSHVRAD
jgi:hypothetical protein